MGSLRAAEIAERLGGRLEGNPDLVLEDVADVERAGPAHLTFVYGSRAAEQLARTQAGCVIVPLELAAPAGRTVIHVADPRAAFARAIQWFRQPRAVPPGIHPTALIEPGVELGCDISVGPYTVIRSGSRIGDGTVIGAHCAIGHNVIIGRRCRLWDRVTLYDEVVLGDEVIIHSGAVLGADGFGYVRTAQGYEKFPQVGRVEVGNRVEIGANCCIDRAALGVTAIGDGTKLDNMVHVGHNVRIGRNVVIAAQTGISGGVVIEDDVVIGGQVGIGDKVRIERGAVLASKCGIPTSKIIRRGQTVWGIPARPLKQYLRDLAEVGRLVQLRETVEQLEARVRQLEAAVRR